MKFSQRIGQSPVRTTLQIDSIDERLRNRLWNIFKVDFYDRLPYSKSAESERDNLCRYIWKEFLILPIDNIPTNIYDRVHVDDKNFAKYLLTWFLENAKWFEVYDFVEFIASLNGELIDIFIEKCNLALREEVAGYRIISKKIVQITAEEEIQAIEEAIYGSGKWKSVNTHLATALALMANRESPDYRNSIKESISAIEALCKIITNDNNATLGSALTKIEKTHKIHGALKTAFSAIYGYSSDSGGIRHSLLESDTIIKFEEAKFMLVACSAFINYLKTKIEGN